MANMNFGEQNQTETARFHAEAAEKAAAEKAVGLPSVLAVSRALKALTADGDVFGLGVCVIGAGFARRYSVAGGAPADTLGAARQIIDALE
jgi:hypothetical protein